MTLRHTTSAKSGRHAIPASIIAKGLAAGLVALAAGCATTSQSSGGQQLAYHNPSYPDADRVFRNGYVEATRPHSAQQAARAAEIGSLAAYDGIAGARRAHKIHGGALAEKLDGACERFVSIEGKESLYDIAAYCDVPVYMLMEYNPSVMSPRHVSPGQMIEVPYIVNIERIAFAHEAGLINAAAYVVQPGDTLNSIAASHLAPAESIVAVNPDVNWRAMPVGLTIRIPAIPSSGVVIGGPTTPSPKPVMSYLGDGDFSGLSGGRRWGGGHYHEVEKLMPYRLRPVSTSDSLPGERGGQLSVNRRTVSPGQTVRISADGLPPNARVTLSSGPNRAELRTVDTVLTGPDGSLDANVRVGRRSDIGGVVITATVDKTGETLYSERVGVLRIEGERKEETANDDLAD